MRRWRPVTWNAVRRWRPVTWNAVVAAVITCIFLARATMGCGGLTHIEISHRALNHFTDVLSGKHYEKLLVKHPDALQAGSPYPDTFYPSICAKGIFHSVSENTHWSEFQNASIAYIHSHYPQPWDEATEKLVVFLFGVVSHQVADISWHSLGIPQGLISTLAQLNFHGQYGDAHTAADVGAEVMNAFELDFSYVDTLKEWYLPVDDLEKIYLELYKKPVVPPHVLVNCSAITYASVAGTILGGREAFPYFAREAPFLLDQKEDYFLGGFNDMAGWVARIWSTLIHRLEKDNRGCSVPHNPLFIHCNDSGAGTLSQDPSWPLRYPEKNGFYTEPTLWPVSADDVIVEKHLRGVILRPSQRVKDLLQKKKEDRKMRKTEREKRRVTDMSKPSISNVKGSQLIPSHVYTVNQSYAKIGWSFAVGDVNQDGRQDVAVGAPGWGSPRGAQEGRVFILYGRDGGLPSSEGDLDKVADLRIPGPPGQQSRFGAALALLDINQDGLTDLVVGAPSLGSNNLTYNGGVYIYFGSNDTSSSLKNVNVTITCTQQTYCGLGWVLAVGDINGDGHDDLIVGAPFAPGQGQGQQRGLVAALYSSTKVTGSMVIPVERLDWFVYGKQDYGWFGYSVAVRPHPSGGSLLMIGQPGFRICARKDCQLDPKDLQAVGRLWVYRAGTGSTGPVLLWQLTGSGQFSMLGSAADLGTPYGDGSAVLAVSAPGDTGKGSVVEVPVTLRQMGRVSLYNVSSLTSSHPPLLAGITGDRRYSHFGNVVKFADLHGKGVDDLIIGNHLRTSDFTEELTGAEEGKVYIFSGGPGFPTGDVTYRCGALTLLVPCPGEKASEEISFSEDLSQFGGQVAIVKSKNQTSLLVTALHSSRGARLSSAIGLVPFQNSL